MDFNTPHALTSFEIQKCYKNEPRCIGVYTHMVQ